MATQKLHFAQNLYGLTPEAIRQAVPSVYAEAAHESRSSRYALIPTSDILTALDVAGFVPTQVMQGRTRFEGREAFTKHMMRLRTRDDLGVSKPEVHEVVIVNSHDGTSAYDLMAGFFRMVCANGCIAGDIDTRLKVYHKGNIAEQVVKTTVKIVEESGQMMETIARMKEVQLTEAERLMFAEYVIRARFGIEDEALVVDGEIVGEIPAPARALVPYQPADFLQPQRSADRGNDLFKTFSVLQERAIKGHVSRRDRKGKRHTTRAINGIDQSVKVNRLVWQFAQELLKFKS